MTPLPANAGDGGLVRRTTLLKAANAVNIMKNLRIFYLPVLFGCNQRRVIEKRTGRPRAIRRSFRKIHAGGGNSATRCP
jgi:hypothetical protein